MSRRSVKINRIFIDKFRSRETNVKFLSKFYYCMIIKMLKLNCLSLLVLLNLKYPPPEYKIFFIKHDV